LKKQNMTEQESGTICIFAELSQYPPVASGLAPSFLKLTDGSLPCTPKLFFVELKPGELGTNPLCGSPKLLPYQNRSP
jgi:hypothetical protein